MKGLSVLLGCDTASYVTFFDRHPLSFHSQYCSNYCNMKEQMSHSNQRVSSDWNKVLPSFLKKKTSCTTRNTCTLSDTKIFFLPTSIVLYGMFSMYSKFERDKRPISFYCKEDISEIRVSFVVHFQPALCFVTVPRCWLRHTAMG